MLIKQERNKCAVVDGIGNNCPNIPMHIIEHNGKESVLCKHCYLAYKQGAWDSGEGTNDDVLEVTW